MGAIQYAVKQLPVPDPLSKSEEIRIAQVRELLRQAAATARRVQPAGGDLDKATNQAWLYTQFLRLISDLFTFEIYKDFRDFMEGREKKMKQHGEKGDSKSHLTAIAGYFEKLADRLRVDDIDPQAKLPASFVDFAKGPG